MNSVFLSLPPNAVVMTPRGVGMMPRYLPSGLITWTPALVVT